MSRAYNWAEDKISELAKRIEELEAGGREEMENYRMALAYISKQSTDPQSRELAETALSFTESSK